MRVPARPTGPKRRINVLNGSKHGTLYSLDDHDRTLCCDICAVDLTLLTFPSRHVLDAATLQNGM